MPARPRAAALIALVMGAGPLAQAMEEDRTAESPVLIAAPKTEPAPIRLPIPPPRPPVLRLRLAAGLAEEGPNGTMATWPGGSRQDSTCTMFLSCGFTPVLELGLDWSPSRYVGAGMRARWIVADTTSNLLGRHFNVVEVLFAPQFHFPWPWRWPRGGLRPYLALPIGPAWSFESRAWTRAVAEDWQSRVGLSLGADLGFEFYLTRRWGFVVETSYQERFLSADVVETPVAEPQAQATERVTLTQRHLTVSLGLLLALDPQLQPAGQAQPVAGAPDGQE